MLVERDKKENAGEYPKSYRYRSALEVGNPGLANVGGPRIYGNAALAAELLNKGLLINMNSMEVPFTFLNHAKNEDVNN